MSAARLFCVGSSVLLLACGSGEPPASTAAPTPSATEAPAPVADAKTLVGRWLRADSDYVIEIVGVGADGSLDAKYWNPQPIHVSRAEWKKDGERLLLAVELTDRNYPGNFYTLLYDPGSDALVGAYRHVGLNQSFEVAFSRLPN